VVTHSTFQEAIFNHYETSPNHLLIDACAGTGKTYTNIEGVKLIPPGSRILCCAFNKGIAEELKKKVPRTVQAKTFHSIGLGAITSHLGPVEVDPSKDGQIAREIAKEVRWNGSNAWEARGYIKKLASMGKNMGIDGPKDLVKLAYRFQCESEDFPGEVVATWAWEAMVAAREITSRISFDDMVWFPYTFSFTPPKYDVVFADEAQDLNPVQVSLVEKSVKQGGKLIICGDPRQAIYAFRGACKGIMDSLAKDMAMDRLTLPITYRCPRVVVELVQPIVPHYQPGPDNAQGEIKAVKWTALADILKPGDFVLSRVNAPLLGLCMTLIRAGTPATILGRNIGVQIQDLIKQSKAPTIDLLITWAIKYEQNQRARLEKLGHDDSIGPLADRVNCLVTIAKEFDSIVALQSHLDSLFSVADASRFEAKVVLSSVHKAKGLEADNVFLIADTFNRGRCEEEDNLFYVAATRAKQTLYFVSREDAE